MLAWSILVNRRKIPLSTTCMRDSLQPVPSRMVNASLLSPQPEIALSQSQWKEGFKPCSDGPTATGSRFIAEAYRAKRLLAWSKLLILQIILCCAASPSDREVCGSDWPAAAKVHLHVEGTSSALDQRRTSRYCSRMAGCSKKHSHCCGFQFVPQFVDNGRVRRLSLNLS